MNLDKSCYHRMHKQLEMFLVDNMMMKIVKRQYYSDVDYFFKIERY
jgi:hypothetical protein